jgi:hypothetical protein
MRLLMLLAAFFLVACQPEPAGDNPPPKPIGPPSTPHY